VTMMNSMKSPFKINRGTVIRGKWHKKEYTIIKELGFGANGTVFLADSSLGKVALKLSDNGMSIISEVNVLKSFAKVQGYSLGPSLIDVDDWNTTSGTISFHVMEYINGPNLLSFIENRDDSWVNVLMIQLLKDLQVLHENNWVFGDLKPENLIINGPPTRIRCIDVGGTTIIGRAIKEFTEFYDRGYWGLGSRKAEPSYDLFAVAMIMINIYYPNRFNKVEGGLKQLQIMIQKKRELVQYENVLIKALTGRYRSADEMRKELIQLSSGNETRTASRTSTNTAVRTKSPAVSTSGTKGRVQAQQGKRTKKKKRTGYLESILLIVVISLLYIVYIYGQMT